MPAWIALGGLALLQAWIFRHDVSPDGVAYLDLSDAVVAGRLGDLVNGYWSPLYPTLIGITRLLLGSTSLVAPESEFALVHLVNLLGFFLALAAFEWFLRALDDAAERWRGDRPFAGAVARTTAYALFGIASLAMIEVKGTVPDMFVAAACLAAFACLLRLRDHPTDRRAALTLGAVLGIGALAKSFMIPLGVVMLATIAVPLFRARALVRLALAGGVFAAVMLPWLVALSLSLGRPTFGTTGELNYAWWVNGKPAPPHVMPVSAAPTERLPLAGLGVMPDAPGTNPVWFDPSRWYRDLRPEVTPRRQITRIWVSIQYYAYVLAPFLIALAAFGAGAPLGDVRTALGRAYPVVLPCLAGFAAYALVFTTSRYVAPFLLSACLALAAAFPPGTRLRGPLLVTASVVTVVALDLIAPLEGRIWLAYGLVIAIVAWVVVVRERLDEPAVQASLRRVIGISAVATAAIPPILMGAAALRQARSADPHPQLTTARRLMQGIPVGSKIAVLGTPSQVGWARIARFRIVAVIPAHRADAFKALSATERLPIIEAFRKAGAVQLVDLTGIPIP